jgi:membrane-bound lytic murein transglycosylase A
MPRQGRVPSVVSQKFLYKDPVRRLLALLVLPLTSCAGVPAPSPLAAPPHLVRLDAAQCRAVLDDDAPVASLQQAVARSLDYFKKVPADRALTALDRQVAAAEIVATLQALPDGRTAGSDITRHVCDQLRVYRVEMSDRLLVTGYYQPELVASRTRSERFRYPLYRTPADLIDVDLGRFCAACAGRVGEGRVDDGKVVPYYSRAEIEGGVLAGRGDEMAWLDDPVDAFFLHVQGSALLRFDDGVHMEVSYSSSNGRPYTSIGRILIEQGKLSRDTVSLQALKDYLRAHPDEQAALLAANQRYIFFRTVAAGPIGSLGVPLTAGRSIAADANVYPPGTLAFLRIMPRAAEPTASGQPAIARFVVVQDAGAAISGPNRVDVFWGTGASAEALAGEMRNPGELYLVLPQEGAGQP